MAKCQSCVEKRLRFLLSQERERNKALSEELDKFKNGYQGGCYACEIVGEKNVALEAENKALREALGLIIRSGPQCEDYATDIAKAALEVSDD